MTTKKIIIQNENNSVDFLNFTQGINRLPIYEIILERFTQMYRVSLSNSIRVLTDLSHSTEVCSFKEWVDQTEEHCSMLVARVNRPGGGPWIAAFQKDLALYLIDRLLGGNGKKADFSQKELTTVELSIMKDVYELLLGDWAEAFDPVAKFESSYIRQEVNPQFIGIVPPTSKVIVTTFKVDFDNIHGSFQLVVPYSTLFPIRDQLAFSHK